ncbi:MAG: hypothetical protein JF606_29700, partial [Burkholderiales bacterium]|nr:hypothetical protein [Burkholderiales bacterium]
MNSTSRVAYRTIAMSARSDIPANSSPGVASSQSWSGRPWSVERQLSAVQYEVWLDQMLTPQQVSYTIGGWLEFEGHVELDVWERAIGELLARHDALRLILLEGAPVPVQRVLEPWVFELARHDYSDRSDGQEQALQHLQRAYARPFQMYGQPLWEMQWVQATATRGYCLCRFHHLAMDGSAVALVLNELTHIYNRLLHGQLPDLPAAPSYLAHLADEDSYRASPRFAGDRQFWLDRFSRVPQPLWPRPPNRVLRQPTQLLLWEIPRQRYVQLGTAAQALGGSIAQLLMLGFAQYFARL